MSEWLPARFSLSSRSETEIFDVWATHPVRYAMEVSGDDIANVVLEQFDKLPAKRKPQVRGPGVREWVPLSGIVAQGVGKLLL